MTDFASATLGVALAFSIAAAALAITDRLAGRARSWRSGLGARVRRFAATAGLLSLPVAAVSSVYHLTIDHGPDTQAPMGLGDFVGEHTAYLVTAALAVAALAVLRLTGPQRDRDS